MGELWFVATSKKGTIDDQPKAIPTDLCLTVDLFQNVVNDFKQFEYVSNWKLNFEWGLNLSSCCRVHVTRVCGCVGWWLAGWLAGWLDVGLDVAKSPFETCKFFLGTAGFQPPEEDLGLKYCFELSPGFGPKFFH